MQWKQYKVIKIVMKMISNENINGTGKWQKLVIALVIDKNSNSSSN